MSGRLGSLFFLKVTDFRIELKSAELVYISYTEFLHRGTYILERLFEVVYMVVRVFIIEVFRQDHVQLPLLDFIYKPIDTRVALLVFVYIPGLLYVKQASTYYLLV
jgi:hypothetical protein